MTRSAMRRLRAANPVPELPAPTPIDAVLPTWPQTLVKPVVERPDPVWHSRTSRFRTVIPAALGVVVAAAVVITALVAINASKRTGTTTASPPAAEPTYTDPEGWSVTYPSSFSLVRQPAPVQFASVMQVTLASFAAPGRLVGQVPHNARDNVFQSPYALPLDGTGHFPADAVALILQPSRVFVLGADSAFPVALSQFGSPHVPRFFSSAEVRRATIPLARTREIVAYGQELTAVALIGAKASPTLRSELANAIASLSFAHLAPGTAVAGAVLLGPATNYPVGSFTLVHARFANGRIEPIYLVHAPGRLTDGHGCQSDQPCTPAGSFYGIGPDYNTRDTHAPLCQLRLDRRPDEFYCGNLGVRWDRVGRVISRPASESYIGSIEGLYAKVAWDGQVLIMPGFGPRLSRAAVHQLWPSWRQPNEPLSR